MPYSHKTLTIVDLTKGFTMRIPAPSGMEATDKATTLFSMAEVDDCITLIGTYDQIMDFAADIAQKMMSWPIVTKNLDWLGDELDVVRETANGSIRGQDRRGSEAEGAESGAGECEGRAEQAPDGKHPGQVPA